MVWSVGDGGSGPQSGRPRDRGMSGVCRPQGVWPGMSIGRLWCRLTAQPFDFGHRGGAGPLLDKPLG